MVALTGFSGAVTSRFPLPLSLAAIVAIAAIAMPGVLAWRMPMLGAAVASFIFVAVVVTQPVSSSGSGMRDVGTRFALEAGELREVALPVRARSVRLVLSAGNVVDLVPDTPLCSIEAIDGGGRLARRDLTLRDAADWGGSRRDHFFTSRNEWPARLAGVIEGFGHEAFLPGAAELVIAVPDMRVLRVTAARSLPARSRLIVESMKAEVAR
jgi:hypothetical protein